ncbi:hypothetical protein [Sediminibacterium sp.]|uniref:hypothetical protein n=1 Tax=Sediminibacterium sp. TaxID=1917865 RepID=UPI003F6E9530
MTKSRNKIKLQLTLALIIFSSSLIAQNINWASLQKNQRHIININTGIDFGLTYGIGYGHQLKSKHPIILSGEFSLPSGNNLLDDFKIKIGGTIHLAKIENFQVSARLYSVFRRYENTLVRLVNFGSDISATAGYYKSGWHFAVEIGFDKSIVTHFKHSKLYKENYPDVQDGWFEPATGGNFFYGFQSGISFKKHDIYLKLGKLITQDFRTTPSLPILVQLGYNSKIK